MDPRDHIPEREQRRILIPILVIGTVLLVAVVVLSALGLI